MIMKDDYEIRVIADIAQSVKDTIRRDSKLRNIPE